MLNLYEVFQDNDFINKALIRKYNKDIKETEDLIKRLDQHNKFYAEKIRTSDNEFVRYWCQEEMKINQNNLVKVEKRLFYLKKQRLVLYRALKEKSIPKQEEKIDLDIIKKIPIKNILELYNISFDKFRRFKVREEKTPSCSFNEEKNLWVDYGNRDYGGSVIDLVMVLDRCSIGQAINKLKQYVE